MKVLLFSVLILTSSLSFASGYECKGGGYVVKLYNHAHPELGTKNPAVLIIASEKDGSVAVVRNSDIQKVNLPESWIYSGMANHYSTGRFVHVEVQIAKEPGQTGPFAGIFFGKLTINADNATELASLTCQPYLKN